MCKVKLALNQIERKHTQGQNYSEASTVIARDSGSQTRSVEWIHDVVHVVSPFCSKIVMYWTVKGAFASGKKMVKVSFPGVAVCGSCGLWESWCGAGAVWESLGVG